MEWNCVYYNINRMTDTDIREYHSANQQIIELKLQAGISGWRKSTQQRYNELVKIVEEFENKKRSLQ